MTHVDAIFQGGLFRPLGHVNLPENQRVQLQIQAVESTLAATWLDDARRLQQEIIAKRGHFPVSTADIAADRARE